MRRVSEDDRVLHQDQGATQLLWTQWWKPWKSYDQCHSVYGWETEEWQRLYLLRTGKVDGKVGMYIKLLWIYKKRPDKSVNNINKEDLPEGKFRVTIVLKKTFDVFKKTLDVFEKTLDVFKNSSWCIFKKQRYVFPAHFILILICPTCFPWRRSAVKTVFKQCFNTVLTVFTGYAKLWKNWLLPTSFPKGSMLFGKR